MVVLRAVCPLARRAAEISEPGHAALRFELRIATFSNAGRMAANSSSLAPSGS